MVSDSKLGLTTRTLHWAVALVILPLTCMGLIMTAFELWSFYDLHKSIGILSLALILPRVIVRIKRGWPKPLGAPHRWQLRIAKMTHWSMLILTLLMPLSGMLYSGASGNGFSIFGLTILPENIVNNEVLAYHSNLSIIGQTTHQFASYALLGCIALHIGGVLFYHFIIRDRTLVRMVGSK